MDVFMRYTLDSENSLTWEGHDMITESELIERIVKVFEYLINDPDEYLKECNRILGTSYTADEIDWDN